VRAGEGEGLEIVSPYIAPGLAPYSPTEVADGSDLMDLVPTLPTERATFSSEPTVVPSSQAGSQAQRRLPPPPQAPRLGLPGVPGSPSSPTELPAPTSPGLTEAGLDLGAELDLGLGLAPLGQVPSPTVLPEPTSPTEVPAPTEAGDEEDDRMRLLEPASPVDGPEPLEERAPTTPAESYEDLLDLGGGAAARPASSPTEIPAPTSPVSEAAAALPSLAMPSSRSLRPPTTVASSAASRLPPGVAHEPLLPPSSPTEVPVPTEAGDELHLGGDLGLPPPGAARPASLFRPMAALQARFLMPINNNMIDSDFNPPSSEKPMYLNEFINQSPAQHQEDMKNAKRQPVVHDTKDLIRSHAADPHNKYGMAEWVHVHYDITREPTFPRKPDLSKGELAAGATVTRTDVWHDPKEPAITSVAKFSPENFRPVGWAENAPQPTTTCPEGYLDNPRSDESESANRHMKRILGLPRHRKRVTPKAVLVGLGLDFATAPIGSAAPELAEGSPEAWRGGGEGSLASAQPTGWSTEFVVVLVVSSFAYGIVVGGFFVKSSRTEVPPLGAMAVRTTGQFHYVRYNVGGPAIYHERLTLLPGYILAPGDDDYAESDLAGGDLRSVRDSAGQGDAIVGVAAHSLYKFRRLPSAAVVWAAVRRGVAQGHGPLPPSPFNLELSADNVLGVAAGVLALPDPLGAAPAAAAPGALALAGAAAPPAGAPGPPAAVAAAPEGGVGALAAAFGAGPAALPAAADPPGVGGAAAAPAAPGVAGPDPRVMATVLDARGLRDMPFSGAVKRQTETPGADWPVRGPRTTMRVPHFMLRMAGGAMAWHNRWMAMMQALETDDAAKLHETLCRVIETSLCHDQLIICELASYEFLSRQLQLVEERFFEERARRTHPAPRAKGQAKDGAASAAADASSEIGHFLGAGETMGNLCICPALMDWIADQMKSEEQETEEDTDEAEEHVGEEGKVMKRGFRLSTSGFVMMSITRAVVCKLLHGMWPAMDVFAAGVVEVDLRPVRLGQNFVVKWRNKPVFIRKRTQAMIDSATKDDCLAPSMREPATDAQRCKKSEWLICIGVCTHLGCIPQPDAGNYGGYFCPCHGSHYDHAGRIRQGPAPKNLEVPPHSFIDEFTVKLG
ncbi:unnamed protein product, partial [Prorocentrum cordatum]